MHLPLDGRQPLEHHPERDRGYRHHLRRGDSVADLPLLRERLQPSVRTISHGELPHGVGMLRQPQGLRGAILGHVLQHVLLVPYSVYPSNPVHFAGRLERHLGLRDAHGTGTTPPTAAVEPQDRVSPPEGQ